MAQEWILELLSDLRKVSEKTGLCELAEHLDDAMVIAAQEMQMTGVPQGSDYECHGMGQQLSGSLGAHEQS